MARAAPCLGGSQSGRAGNVFLMQSVTATGDTGMMLGLQWDSACPLWVLGEADPVWKLEGLRWAGGMQAVPTPANPEVQLRWLQQQRV